jgi:hypothetical protein
LLCLWCRLYFSPLNRNTNENTENKKTKLNSFKKKSSN